MRRRLPWLLPPPAAPPQATPPCPAVTLLPGLLLVAALCGEGAPAPLPFPEPRSETPPRTPPPVVPSETQRPDGAGGSANGSSSSSSSLAAVPAPPEATPPMTQRALSVLVLASAGLIVYFVIRTVRLRRRNRKTRRYGVLDTNIENTELTPLEQDDDEDDTTLFDANHPRR
ncbi:membrane protein FAM174A [Sceloporus undulatus]|uniref:membrane protein FAM174A n=1 Tax=Sceloporus undulatus TaxID=8520 RepID=UPI001C4AABC0|nr:membrane protein FAM174A [Sceloporus undulatus]